MFKGIKEAVTKQDQADHWATDLELEPEIEETYDPSGEQVMADGMPWESHYSPSNGNDYYLELIRTALSQGGKRGAYEIPIPWLRMTYAGLQGHAVDPEEFWVVAEDSGLPSNSGSLPSQ
jgi:hypothetical protein